MIWDGAASCVARFTQVCNLIYACRSCHIWHKWECWMQPCASCLVENNFETSNLLLWRSLKSTLWRGRSWRSRKVWILGDGCCSSKIPNNATSYEKPSISATFNFNRVIRAVTLQMLSNDGHIKILQQCQLPLVLGASYNCCPKRQICQKAIHNQTYTLFLMACYYPNIK